MKRNKGLKGLFWSFTDNILQQVANFIVGIILARILLPEEFGVFGVVSLFIAILNVFVNNGLSDALIYKREPTEKEYNTVFWANVFLGLFTYLVLYFVAPLIAFFFNQEALINLIRITAVSIVLISFSSIHRTIFIKNIDFKTITIISVIAVFLSGTVAVYMAENGFGIMSLVIRVVLGQFISLLLFWVLNNWRPKLLFDFNAFKKMYHYGVPLFWSRLVNSLYDNLYFFVIGKFFSPASLGYYTRAKSFENLASRNIINTVQRVSFSTLSAIEDKKNQLELFKKIILGTFFVTSFFMTVLFVCANEIVLILIGNKWIQSIEYLKILSVSGLFMPLYSLNINYLAVNDKTRLNFKIELFTKLFAVPIILIGIYFGILAMLVSISIISVVNYFISVFFIDQLFDYKFKSQIYLVFKGVLLFVLSVSITQLIDTFENFSLYYKVLLNSTVICCVFLIGFRFLFTELIVVLKNLKLN